MQFSFAKKGSPRMLRWLVLAVGVTLCVAAASCGMPLLGGARANGGPPAV